MSVPATTREFTIKLRARKPQRDLIDRAAESQGKTRTEFMLGAACEKAHEILADQTVCLLDQRRYNRLLELLDKPIARNKALASLLASPAPWDK